MKRLILLLAAVLLAFTWTLAVGAQQDSSSWSGEIGSEATVYPSFADYSWFSLSFDVAAFTLFSTTSLSYASPISISQTLGLSYGLDWFTLGSKLSTPIYPSAFSSIVATIYSTVTLFEVPLGNPSSFSGAVGASATVYPAVTDDVWLDLSLVLDAFSVTSKTSLALMPFGFSQQRIDLGFAFDGFSVYVWGALSGATFDPSGGVGFLYGFP